MAPKRPQAELKHILDAVQVLALSNPHVSFSLEHDGNSLLRLEAEEGEERSVQTASRISALFPVGRTEDLIGVEESTSYMAVRGFLGRPDDARRSRGLQFLFVNGRWVKHRYLEHAVLAAYEYLLPEGSYPFFTLFLDIDPRHVDVNVHPTKSEVKFDDERGVYGMLRAVVGRALGTSFRTPDFGASRPVGGFTLDLNEHPGHGPRSNVDSSRSWKASDSASPTWPSAPRTDAGFAGDLADASRTLYEGAGLLGSEADQGGTPSESSTEDEATIPAGAAQRARSHSSGLGEEGLLWQLHDTYILTQILSGLVIIDQQMAHERILYEQARNCLKDGFGLSQQLLFPRTIEFSASEFALLTDLMEDLGKLGFDIEPFGGNSVIVRGVPADIAAGDERSILDEIVDQYRMFERVESLSGRENLARSMARRGAVRAGIKLSPKEMRALIDQLFQCESPYVSPDGRPTMIRLSGNELRERFDQKRPGLQPAPTRLCPPRSIFRRVSGTRCNPADSGWAWTVSWWV